MRGLRTGSFQVRYINGVRRASGLMLALAVFGVALDGERCLFMNVPLAGSQVGTLIGVGEILGASVAFWFFIERWLRQVATVVYLGAFRSLVGLLMASTVTPPFRSVS